MKKRDSFHKGPGDFFSSIMSVCSSVRSNGSSKYRRISDRSTVDQSLFGPRRSNENNFRRREKEEKEPPALQNSISLSELNRIKESTAAPLPAACLSTKAAANEDEKAAAVRSNPATSETAKARKAHMKRLELEELDRQRKSGSRHDDAKLERIRKHAQEKIDEGQDIVKLLRTCSERATTFAIRDQQLKDKADREKKEHAYEQRMILAMEIDRLKEIEAREAEEALKLHKMVHDRKIIENQIEERRQARLLLEEARDQENKEMLEQMQSYREQDEANARARREEAARARNEIIRANEEHIRSKKERKILEKREDEMMVAYQLEQDEKMRQREAEEEEAERTKREVQKKLLDEQERTMDRQSEMDELRARRAMEDAERKYRQKQLLDAQRRRRNKEMLDEARRQQQDEKERREEARCRARKDEYREAMAQSLSMAERERLEAERAEKKNQELIRNLQQQIRENALKEEETRKEKYREGSLLLQEMAEEKAKLHFIRDRFVQEMKSKQIPERYFSEIAMMDFDKMKV